MRINRAAERAGTSARSFILEAIVEKVEHNERRAEFEDTADRRYAQIVESGKTVPWSDVRRNIERRLTREKVTRPKPRARGR